MSDRDDIIRMAREAGFVLHAYPDENWLKLMERFAALVAALVAAHEREACAKVCEEYDTVRQDNYACLCAEAIRKRGEVKP